MRDRPKPASQVPPKQTAGEPSHFQFRIYEAAVRDLAHPATTVSPPPQAGCGRLRRNAGVLQGALKVSGAAESAVAGGQLTARNARSRWRRGSICAEPACSCLRNVIGWSGSEFPTPPTSRSAVARCSGVGRRTLGRATPARSGSARFRGGDRFRHARCIRWTRRRSRCKKIARQVGSRGSLGCTASFT